MIEQKKLWMTVAAMMLTLPLAAACDDEADDDDGGSGGSTSTSTSTSNGSGQGGSTSGGGGASSSGSGGSVATIPVCQLACATVSDCSNGLAAYDEDNYTCTDGWCHYLGCNNDGECQSLQGKVCRDIGVGFLSCVDPCGSVAQCAQSSPPYDADNYACTDGWCHYLGCNSDTECQGMGNYVCRDAGAGMMTCLMACSAPADCDIGGGPAYGADNYSCVDGGCHYLGCNDDSECQAIGDYVCR